MDTEQSLKLLVTHWKIQVQEFDDNDVWRNSQKLQ
jgi:hypothetical protein